jgi:hypothetical protein
LGDDRWTLQRRLRELDPGRTPLLRLAVREHAEHRGYMPRVGDDVAMHATAAMQGLWSASPSWGGFPVVGRVTRVGRDDLWCKL